VRRFTRPVVLTVMDVLFPFFLAGPARRRGPKANKKAAA